jgi:hypothetical protein
MGLDMYLTAKKYIGYNEEQAEAVGQAVGSPFGPAQQVTVEAGYWRKVNAIHSWFVANCQGGVDQCQETELAREDLELLRDICRRIMADPGLANELLPPQAGFFFGSQEIDDWYLQGIQQTIDILDRVLSDSAQGWDFYYRSSW